MSPTRSNISKEEEALKLAIEQVNEDTVNYPGIKLRSLIRYADPDIDFDNIEQGKEKLRSNRRQLATFRSEYEYDYEYEFSVLSTRCRFKGRNFSKCACSEIKTRTRSRPRTPI